MLTCGFQELNLSLLEIWGNVKGKEKFTVRHSKLSEAEVRELASKLTA